MFGFVGLKVANKVPVDIIWQMVDLCLEFLGFALAKVSEPEVIGGVYVTNGKCFADGNEGDLGGVSLDRIASTIDLFLDAGEVVGNLGGHGGVRVLAKRID